MFALLGNTLSSLLAFFTFPRFSIKIDLKNSACSI